LFYVFTILSYLYLVFDDNHTEEILEDYVIWVFNLFEFSRKYLNFFVNWAISYILIQLLMSTRVRNPEVYVKGYGKNTTKDDLK
jgi:hypothetical protein